jgi:hypothetical protein
MRFVDGPKRVWLLNAKVQKLIRYVIKDDEYARMHNQHGMVYHHKGPQQIFEDPINIESIEVKKAINIGPDEAYIIKREVINPKQEMEVKGTVLLGPMVYTPDTNEMVEKINIHYAQKNEYIRTINHDGVIEHHKGPCKLPRNPFLYKTMDTFSAHRVEPNRAILVYDKKEGMISGRIYNGPYIYIPEPNDMIEELKTYVATAEQYLKIIKNDGHTENISGPIKMVLNPQEITKIEVANAININTGEAIVVYCDLDNRTIRRVIHGPTSYIPKTKEWLQNFSWHGSDPQNPHVKKRSMLNFYKIKTLPNQIFYNMDKVRTMDDTLLTIRLAIFFQMENIEMMLDNTNDIIADFMNGASSDVTNFVAEHDFASFKRSVNELNNLELYKRLIERADKIGYKINKVIFRSYSTTDAIQQMHDKAIETRTKLLLEKETEEQSQELLNFKIEQEMERNKKKHELEKADVIHKLEIERVKHESVLQRKKEEQMLNLETIRNSNSESSYYLEGLEKMGVDLTQYLVAKEQGGPHKWIKVDGSNDPKLHLHNP